MLRVGVVGLFVAGPCGPAAWAASTMPPEIEAIFKRMANGGGAPSAEDQRKLELWGKSILPDADKPDADKPDAVKPPGADDGSNGGRLVLTIRDRPGGEACPAPDRAVASLAKIDKAAYLAMAQDAVRGYGRQIPQDGRKAIETALADRAKPVAGGDLAVALIAKGYGSAAVMAAARGAIANPDDANTANTLGTALRGMEDYKRATVAMGYAAVLSPGSALLASNRAWLAFSQGDMAGATALFSAAAYAGPPSPSVFLGQAMIEECAGNHAKALPLFRTSLSMQWSDIAAAGVQWAEKSIVKAAGPGGTPDLGSPDAYGGKAEGKGTPYWPDPPMPPTAQELASNLKVGYTKAPTTRWDAGWHDAVQANLSAAAANPTRLSETVIDDTSTTMTYGYERQLFILDDVFTMIDARDAAGVNKFIQQTADALERDGVVMHNDTRELEAMSCGAVRARNTTTYIGYNADARGRWTDVRKAMADLYGFSSDVIASIDDPISAAGADAILASRANLMAIGYSTQLMFWTLETDAAWSFKDFQCVVPPPKPRPVGTLKPYKIDPNACHTGELHMNFGIINLNADCNHMVLTFGRLLQGSLDYTFGKDWDHDTLTVWAGAGFGTNGSATKGSVTAGAQAGVYATLGTGGALIDAGISTSGGVTVGATNAGALPGGSFEPGPPPPDIGSGQGGITAQGTIAARISLIDGPPNPVSGAQAQAGEGEITTSSGITFGANATSSTTSGRAMHVPP